MTVTSDLKTALEFVIRRIQDEANQSGQPLTEEQLYLLQELPTKPLFSESNFPDPESAPLPVPRDLAYERLCALAKAAFQKDRRQKVDLRSWHFAFAVTRLYHHPMSWLLRWAGLKELRPWWDQWLLLVTALMAIAGWMSLYFLNIEMDAKLRWLVFVIGAASLYGLAYLVTRKLERFELKRAIEKNRPSYSSA